MPRTPVGFPYHIRGARSDSSSSFSRGESGSPVLPLTPTTPTFLSQDPFQTPEPSRPVSPSTSAAHGLPSYSRKSSAFGSRASSIYGARSGFQYGEIPGTGYFRSRRIVKGEAPPIVAPKPSKNDKLLWILPLCGLFLGLALAGLAIFVQVQSISKINYCPVFEDDFGGSSIDSSKWNREVQVGGFGNQQFDETTASDDNSFVKDGMLYIKPTLQDATLIETNTVLNRLADGSCTSNKWVDCVVSTNTTNGTIVPPTRSARLNTKGHASIAFGKVEVVAKLPKGDWLWPAIWMLPVNETYGAWPASGEIDIIESRGNNHSYSLGGSNFVSSSLHWGPDEKNDGYRMTHNTRTSPHSEYGDQFHTFGLMWNEKFMFTYTDDTLTQVMYWPFSKSLWSLGNFAYANSNGTQQTDPWGYTGRKSTPFDQEFYLILNVAVGGQNGYFLDGQDGKPWVDASPYSKKDFWNARNQWYPTWEKNGQMVVDSVKMWKEC